MLFSLFQARSGKLQPCLHHSGIKPQLVQDCSNDVITRGPRSPKIRGGTHTPRAHFRSSHLLHLQSQNATKTQGLTKKLHPNSHQQVSQEARVSQSGHWRPDLQESELADEVLDVLGMPSTMGFSPSSETKLHIIVCADQRQSGSGLAVCQTGFQ